ncbi:MAG: hypothetical protein J3R72DRAFT_433292 [Linnemannia gamsii]|nr:MAG: hypothetical protein J3R72DRAFT_433292 [Linnemannia gamsii]
MADNNHPPCRDNLESSLSADAPPVSSAAPNTTTVNVQTLLTILNGAIKPNNTVDLSDIVARLAATPVAVPESTSSPIAETVAKDKTIPISITHSPDDLSHLEDPSDHEVLSDHEDQNSSDERVKAVSKDRVGTDPFKGLRFPYIFLSYMLDFAELEENADAFFNPSIQKKETLTSAARKMVPYFLNRVKEDKDTLPPKFLFDEKKLKLVHLLTRWTSASARAKTRVLDRNKTGYGDIGDPTSAANTSTKKKKLAEADAFDEKYKESVHRRFEKIHSGAINVVPDVTRNSVGPPVRKKPSTRHQSSAKPPSVSKLTMKTVSASTESILRRQSDEDQDVFLVSSSSGSRSSSAASRKFSARDTEGLDDLLHLVEEGMEEEEEQQHSDNSNERLSDSRRRKQRKTTHASSTSKNSFQDTSAFPYGAPLRPELPTFKSPPSVSTIGDMMRDTASNASSKTHSSLRVAMGALQTRESTKAQADSDFLKAMQASLLHQERQSKLAFEQAKSEREDAREEARLHRLAEADARREQQDARDRQMVMIMKGLADFGRAFLDQKKPGN